MAKSRKNESVTGTGGKTPKKPAAHKGAGAKPAAAPPMIDTSLAAQTAAKMLVAGMNSVNKPQNPAVAPAQRQESALFKQLKAGLNKPHAAAISNLLEKSHGPEPSKSHPQLKQVGQNQTFGPDVARSGVPRRTPG